MQDIYPASGNQPTAKRAIIVLPEIFGVTSFIKTTTNRLTQPGSNAYALDHFYPLTNQSRTYAYDNHAEPIQLMQKLTGQGFLKQFRQAENQVRQQSGAKEVAVIGFCFGGRLAYLAGLVPSVTRIVSFYGGGSVNQPFYDGHSVIDALVGARQGDDNLKILGLYGSQDESLPEADREQIKRQLLQARISYTEEVYDAGHAFANFERADRHSEEATKSAWAVVERFLAT